MVSSRASSPAWSDSDSDMDDLITPCPCQADAEKQITETRGSVVDFQAPSCNVNAAALSGLSAKPSFRSSSSFSPSSSDASAHPSLSRRCSTDASVDVQGLWEAMLQLQLKYHCYKSTRMMIAADRHDSGDMMPSRACIDLLNDSIEDLPAEGWAVLERYLACDDKASCTQGAQGRWKLRRQQ